LGNSGSGQEISPVPPDNAFADLSQSLDPANIESRKRLRRSELRSADAQPAFPERISAELSPDKPVLSDPHLQAMIQQYSQKGQTIKQSPEESW
jgi:hypothetical protein